MAKTDTDPADDGNDRYLVPALERGLRILGEFSRENRTLAAPELARRFDLPRSTVFRLLATLESLGFIEKTEEGRAYRLGVAVLRLGFEYLASLELNELGMPILSRLSEQLRYPCNLVVRDGRSIVYVAKVSPPTPFVSSVAVGTRLPAHATVLGRVLLQDFSLPELRAMYPEERLESYSPATPRTVLDLFDLLQADRARGHVQGQGFYESHISTIAAPVRDHSGRVVAALGATITTAQIEAARMDEMALQVRAAANELSALLNYAPAAAGRNVVPLRGV